MNTLEVVEDCQVQVNEIAAVVNISHGSTNHIIHIFYHSAFSFWQLTLVLLFDVADLEEKSLLRAFQELPTLLTYCSDIHTSGTEPALI